MNWNCWVVRCNSSGRKLSYRWWTYCGWWVAVLLSRSHFSSACFLTKKILQSHSRAGDCGKPRLISKRILPCAKWHLSRPERSPSHWYLHENNSPVGVVLICSLAEVCLLKMQRGKVLEMTYRAGNKSFTEKQKERGKMRKRWEGFLPPQATQEDLLLGWTQGGSKRDG